TFLRISLACSVFMLRPGVLDVSLQLVDVCLALGHGQRFQDLCNDVFGSDILRFGLVANRHAVAQHIQCEALHVLRRDVAAAVQEGRGGGGHGGGDGRGGRGGAADVAVQVDAVALRVACGPDHIDDVVLELVINVNGIDDVAGGKDVAAGHDRLNGEVGFAGG